MSRSAPSRQPPPRGVPAAAWARLTAFQRRVYAATLRIPKGETRSYQWVAARIGSPRAARAVGQALRRNPFAPRVPCHRVIRADGSLGGYSGGRAHKQALLQAESHTAA
ncbi:MAG: MGMT family protein [Candidatus Omnitrophica bacterium]|nr:MGMT family protein [Candidatus Omnitrophota bacterium]